MTAPDRFTVEASQVLRDWFMADVDHRVLDFDGHEALVDAIATALARVHAQAVEETEKRLLKAVRQEVVDELPGADRTLERILAAFNRRAAEGQG